MDMRKKWLIDSPRALGSLRALARSWGLASRRRTLTNNSIMLLDSNETEGKLRTLDSNDARLRWRELLDLTIAGEATTITRYRKPVAVLIPYTDPEAPQAAQDAIQRARLAEAEAPEEPGK
jgi:antitoxin (DNA-binding transcriptional repressor) of toxin-antitoxin stability system